MHKVARLTRCEHCSRETWFRERGPQLALDMSLVAPYFVYHGTETAERIRKNGGHFAYFIFFCDSDGMLNVLSR